MGHIFDKTPKEFYKVKANILYLSLSRPFFLLSQHCHYHCLNFQHRSQMCLCFKVLKVCLDWVFECLTAKRKIQGLSKPTSGSLNWQGVFYIASVHSFGVSTV